jgi:hypothetical protein
LRFARACGRSGVGIARRNQHFAGDCHGPAVLAMTTEEQNCSINTNSLFIVSVFTEKVKPWVSDLA